jgi:hypothetical protein
VDQKRIKTKTANRIINIGAQQPRLDPKMIATALGAEIVGKVPKGLRHGHAALLLALSKTPFPTAMLAPSSTVNPTTTQRILIMLKKSPRTAIEIGDVLWPGYGMTRAGRAASMLLGKLRNKGWTALDYQTKDAYGNGHWELREEGKIWLKNHCPDCGGEGEFEVGIAGTNPVRCSTCRT